MTIKDIKSAIFFMLILLGLVSCKGSGESYLSNISGKPGELVVVAPSGLWDMSIGDSIKTYLSQPTPSLPSAAEPILDVVRINKDAFGSIFKTARNLMFISIERDLDSTVVELRRSVWAESQAMVNIRVKNVKDVTSCWSENKEKILSYFLNVERERLVKLYNTPRFSEKSIDVFAIKRYGISIKVPKGFQVALDNSEFSWLRFESPETSKGVFIWTRPYVDEYQFSEEGIVAKRDSLLKRYVPGPIDNSYMSTEKRAGLISQVVDHKGAYGVKTKGLWRTEGDFMGGPWAGITILDKKNNRVVTVQGYIYAPKKDKRNLIREVEAMIESVTLDVTEITEEEPIENE